MFGIVVRSHHAVMKYTLEETKVPINCTINIDFGGIFM
jgi:hypothetical protein